MNHLIKLILTLLLMLIGFGVTIGVMIFGWGLEVANWWVILGGVVWSCISMSILTLVTASGDSK